jgi:hypothetical protein
VLIAGNCVDSSSALLLRLEENYGAVTREPNHLNTLIYLGRNEAVHRMIAGANI